MTHYFALLERTRGLGPHAVPYHDLYGAMSLFGWLLALTYLGLELYHRQRTVGALVLPFVLIFFVAAHVAPADKLSPPGAHGPTFAFHVTLNILAYSAFALSFVLSVMFLIEERFLRKHQLGDVVWRLPPLELLERMSRSSVLIGLVSITVGTSFGFLWVYRLSDRYSFYDSKYAITLLVLILYVVYFWLARTTAWRVPHLPRTRRTAAAPAGSRAVRTSRSIVGRAFRDADVLAGRFDRGELVRVRGRVERFREQLQLDVRAIDRAPAGESDPARFLPEVVADAGVIVPPDDPEAWRKALERVIEDTDFAAGMRHRGILRAAQFSWDRASRLTWRAIDEALKRPLL